ncbi:MAG: VCBS repeat-containing protein [Salinibacter sp.]|uniref:VCBS repeat-containing protein n=1 Tax=Salinibacter sp. TaxID=2065818 RepID=UPI0035D4FA33
MDRLSFLDAALAPGCSVFVVMVVLLSGCGGSTEGPTRSKSERAPAPPGSTLFTKLPSSHTNVDFTNRIEYTKNTNVFTYRNYHNGGGVAIADLNNDGLQDLYFTANQKDNRLYLNEGDWWFRDVTDAAGVAGQRAWSTGVTIVDVNGDGWLDIYVCNSGDLPDDDRRNELFINQGTDDNGVPQFEEKAEEYGVADEGYSTHASFFDYDHDGDLDLYLLNNAFTPISTFDLRNTQRSTRDEHGGDKLYENRNGKFVDVSEEAGIYGSEIGFGLGVTVVDVNRDGWQDIYVSNDFFERDYLYINNQDGTFREVLPKQMRHSSLSSMGADFGDLNNDGWPELFVTDMLPETDRRLKTTTTFKPWDGYQRMVRNGYYHQVLRNTLQLNNGNGTFSDISQIAGVHATDWSWGALIADFDLDGYKDIFVANGIYKDVTNQDFIDKLMSRKTARRMKKRGKGEFLNLIDKIPSNRISNYAFRNAFGADSTTGPVFREVAAEWGLDTPSFSNGAAYGDLDNDGDLDLVVNNLNMESFLYRNEADSLRDHHSLSMKLEGMGENPFGIGAQVRVEANGHTFYKEHMPVRGFQSTVGYRLTVGVGEADTLDRVTVTWPDGRVQRITSVAADQLLTVRQSEAPPPTGSDRPAPELPEPSAQPFVDVTEKVDLGAATHQENPFVDFNREKLIPKKLSTEGPRLAVGDVNGDGRDDLYAGGAKRQPGRLLVQQPQPSSEQFVSTNEELFAEDAVSEDLDALFFDADGDGDQDVYVVSGGNEYAPKTPPLEDRLYLNDGTGAFTKARNRLPGIEQSGSVVVASDYDGDGDEDLFVGGRVVPWNYGKNPRSVVLENDGTGHFTDVTTEVAPELRKVGMVTDALWADVTGDGREDLVVVGEWMPISVFENTGGRLERMQPREQSGLAKSHGWWNRVVAADVGDDGDMDLVVGNLGRNTRLDASVEKPTSLYVNDFDRDGSSEPVLSMYRQGKNVPFVLRDPLVNQIPPLKQKFPSHEAYADTPISEVFSDAQLDDALTKRTYTFSTVYVENEGNGSFSVHELPFEAQLAPVYGISADDVNGDGHLDLLLAGNFHGAPPNLGRMDASYGTVLHGNGAGHFTAVPTRESGFLVTGQARDITTINTANRGRLLLVAKNDGPIQVFRRR